METGKTGLFRPKIIIKAMGLLGSGYWKDWFTRIRTTVLKNEIPILEITNYPKVSIKGQNRNFKCAIINNGRTEWCMLTVYGDEKNIVIKCSKVSYSCKF